MGNDTAIAWADHSWSPVKGCQHATLADGTEHPGCQRCYAETMSKRNPATLGVWGPEGTRVITAPSGWDKIRKLHDRVPVGQRQTVFPSICDPFEDWGGKINDNEGDDLRKCPECGWVGFLPLIVRELAKQKNIYGCQACENPRDTLLATMADVRQQFFTLIDETPRFTWLILTKRPQNVRKLWRSGRFDLVPDGVRKNILIGTSISDQATADELLPPLLECRDLCGGLFVSAEPLLSDILLRGSGCEACYGNGDFYDGRSFPCRFCCAIDWLIIGGESGHNHREMPIAAAESLAAQCQAAGVPCFCKQDSGKLPGKQGRLSEAMWALKEFPEALK